MTKSRLLTAFAAALLVVSGCDSTANNDEMATVSFDLDARFNGAAISGNAADVYTLNGRNFTLATARMYLSEVTLLKDDGTEVTFMSSNPVTVPARDLSDNDISHTVQDQIVLAKSDLGTTMYSLGEVEAGRYTGVRFKLGIDGLNNRVDATQVPAGHPLAKQTDRNNHWSWSAGYIYLRLDGQVDTDGDGTPESNFETHIGSTNFLNTIELDHTIDLADGDDADLHIIVDYAKFLEDIDFSDSTQLLCHTADNLPVAQKVKASAADAFEFHGVHVHP